LNVGGFASTDSLTKMITADVVSAIITFTGNKMIRVSVTANNSQLVNAVASIVGQAVSTDILQLSYCAPRSVHNSIHDPRSLLIQIDDGHSDGESIVASELDQIWRPLLVFVVSLNNPNIHIFKTYPLTAVEFDRMVGYIVDFGRTHLGTREPVSGWVLN
jgi:hypothetical protein